MIKKLIIFLLINFGALALGSLFTNTGVSGDWYVNLNKAPWTPPGWVFGTAWTLIMICFSIFMAYAWDAVANKNTLLTLFIIQLILNIGWNPVFFQYKRVLVGLIVISSLTLLLFYFFFNYRKTMKAKIFLLAPYVIWLCIATSLNAYVLMNN